MQAPGGPGTGQDGSVDPSTHCQRPPVPLSGPPAGRLKRRRRPQAMLRLHPASASRVAGRRAQPRLPSTAAAQGAGQELEGSWYRLGCRRRMHWVRFAWWSWLQPASPVHAAVVMQAACRLPIPACQTPHLHGCTPFAIVTTPAQPLTSTRHWAQRQPSCAQARGSTAGWHDARLAARPARTPQVSLRLGACPRPLGSRRLFSTATPPATNAPCRDMLDAAVSQSSSFALQPAALHVVRGGGAGGGVLSSTPLNVVAGGGRLLARDGAFQPMSRAGV